ncbi:EthD family reductase [Thalassomonas actiniarum]|uniref:EthD family reductase n=1 Tax=Thalassomonas actiniarum TaxID=485447 RepID=A0AAE9YTJ4_9GAMM|nr:EthD family reductase [Thalassomonas actiniarum]WDE00005.1 EthD family reductase [Thalassomonas actiniarum]
MIKVSVLYPNSEQAKFNLDYYCNSHMPMVQDKLGNACKKVAVESGLCGAKPEAAAPYIAMGHLYFDSLAEYQQAFAPHAEDILSDIPNYTNTQPEIQISQVQL